MAALEHAIAQSQKITGQRNRQLIEGLHASISTIQQVSNREYQARITLPS